MFVWPLVPLHYPEPNANTKQTVEHYLQKWQ
jgi:hypothetical protein